MYLMIDNYDSFTHNLSAYFSELGCDMRIVENDRVDLALLEKAIRDGELEGLVISPGPKSPEESGACGDALALAAGRVPVLGVCLGHQIIARAAGAEVAKGHRPMHGAVTAIEHDGSGLFRNLPKRFNVTRYHSLVAIEETLPETLTVNARSDDGAVMAISHVDAMIYGVQFHPEAVLTEYGLELLGNFVAICREHRATCALDAESAAAFAPATESAPQTEGTLVRTMPAKRALSDVFDILADLPHAVFLDSSLHGENGRFSIAAACPYLVLEDFAGSCFRNGEPSCRSFEDELRDLLAEGPDRNPADLPLTHGVIGYLSYEFGRIRNRIPTRHEAEVAMPDARMAAYDAMIIEDHRERTLHLIAQGKLRPAEETIAWLEQTIERACERPAPPRQGNLAAFSSKFSENAYKNAVGSVIDYTALGHAYVLNLTQQLKVESTADPYRVYRYLRTHNAAPYSAFLKYEDVRVACSSPERFLSVRQGRVETKPIKGTRPRATTRSEDDRLRNELANSDKDRSELLMVVDLERNDLNRACMPGSVHVSELFSVEDYATVFQLTSTVRGLIDRGKSTIDLLGSAFPGGSITGAPKIRAMEIIDELERSARGLYTGSIGYIASNGDCDLNIVIRTAIEQDGVFHIGAGGGITYDSDPDFEYEETILKARALLEAIAAAQ